MNIKDAFLAHYNSLHALDLDKYTRIATVMTRKPMGLINLLDSQNQYVMSEVGLSSLRDGRMDRCDSFCKYTSLCEKGKIFQIEDAKYDERVQDLPVVTGFPGIRWYAGTPLVTAAGETIGAVCILDTEPGASLGPLEQQGLLDIARCIMEELDLREDCNIALMAQKQFLTSISHEIRNPLHGISMCTELLASTETFTSAGKTSFQTMRSCVTSLTEVLDHILTVSQHKSIRKMKTNRRPEDRISCNLVEILENNIDSAWSASEEFHEARTNIQIDLDVDDRLLCRKFLLHRGEFARVVLNLVSNAVKYTNHGKILVSLKLTDTTTSSQQNGTAHESVVLKISDTGCGIPENSLNEVQLPFFQSEPTNAGTGLGLFVVKCILEEYKGQLEIESEVNKGTTVTATFYLEEEQVTSRPGDSNSGKIENEYHDLQYLRYAVTEPCTIATKVDSLSKTFGLTASDAASADVVIASDIQHSAATSLTSKYLLTFSYPRECLPTAKYSNYECVYAPIGPLKLARAILRVARSSPSDVVEHADGVVDSLRDLDLESTSGRPCQSGSTTKSTSDITPSTSMSPDMSNDAQKGLCLVVDDNIVNVKILRTFLTRRGFECVSAYDGTDAVEAIMSERDRHFDFILMDLNMKKMSGIEASLKIMAFQESKKLRKSTIVAVSACSEAEAQYALSCGIQHFFSKPVKLPQFAKFLEDNR